MKVLAATAAVSANRRFFPLYALVGVLLLLSLITRVALLLRPDTPVPLTLKNLLEAFGFGLFFDLIAAAYFCLPLALFLALLPNALARWRPLRWLFIGLFLAAVYLLWLLVVAEWVFWDEFGVRFNFIAVDYLIYTHEVLGNIWESYPVGKLLILLVGLALLVWLPLVKPIYRALEHHSTRAARLTGVLPWLLAPVLAFAFVSTDMKRISSIGAVDELAGNGIYEFFAANYNNELDFDRFYATVPLAQAMDTTHRLLSINGERWHNDQPNSLLREIVNGGPEKRFNIVLVSIESLGSEFVGSLGNAQGITPNLDALAARSLFFTNLFSTGNRTVRGMEALSLAIPPTPGQSIVKRPRNENLFSLGSVLQDKGYDTVFAYGGYGYFDNMNYFFDHNDYRVVDRTALAKEDIHYENIWGVADEDLFTLAMREMDRTHREHGGKKPFFVHIMTTSNHRPYTYPPDRIDIPSGSSREGAVKYTDYAVGDFLRRASAKPWFADTIFVITADHGASARGTNIPLEKYRIPLFIYSPAHIEPARNERLMSQIDIAPTLLGLLHMSYASKFYGYDMLKLPPGAERAFVANYQVLGYMKAGRMVTLQPQRKVSVSALPADVPGADGGNHMSDDELRAEAIGLYESASYAFKHGLYGKEKPKAQGVAVGAPLAGQGEAR
jgi:phosphoglycerol transferase MdoB-like AlkP superfamily enzyme